ncbi:Resolvase-like protein [Lentisphaera araneosa HTCC2155]|uniref:Resolvase-like protein n=1 Tax=Lentisphaera araneosa HTCC2155 TaxID=313628 RepID=A6DII5_9BACT|nr:recombinase family protein [Lentisphaera araneosa]EDM28271.1 Resolvase-like protein [Lentisphaera araneosa HTCC2155]
MVYAYLRRSTLKQIESINAQELEIRRFAEAKGLTIDSILSETISGKKAVDERKLKELNDKLVSGDTIIAAELSRLGRSTISVIQLIQSLIDRKVRIILVKENIDINGDHDMSSKVLIWVFSMISELERTMLSVRIKESLKYRREQGVVLGRPKGSTSKSVLDGKESIIKDYLNKGISINSMSRLLEVHPGTVSSFIKSRKLRE